jgi:hypothetical protein
MPLAIFCAAALAACSAANAKADDSASENQEQTPARSKSFEQRVAAAIDERGDWSFVDTPLDEVAQYLQNVAGVDVVLDRRSMDDFGIPGNTPVTIQLKGIRLRSLLDLLLQDVDMTWDVRDNAIWFTTLDEAEMNTYVCIYPVTDLVRAGSSHDEVGLAYDAMIDLITTTIAPQSWDEVGGGGSVASLPGTLVISQTRDGHTQVSAFLEAWRRLIAQSEDDAATRWQPIRLFEETNGRVWQALDKPVELDFIDASLAAVAEYISSRCDVPVLMDIRALEDYGIGSNVPITVRTAKLPLRIALRRFLRDLDLTTVVRSEVLMITTLEESEIQLSTVLYPVADLVATSPESTSRAAEFDSLVRAIHSCIAPETWAQVGGPGSLEVIVDPPALVVAQTDEVHASLCGMLEQLRAKRPAPPAAEEEATASRPRLHVYRLQGPLAISQAEVMTLIRRVVQPDSWDREPSVFIETLGTAIVIQHTDQAHREVEALLRKIRPDMPMMGGGMGGGMGGMGGGMGGGFFGVPQQPE